MFQPGRLAWRPIEGAENAVVIHDLRVGAGPLARESVARLWAVVGNFATYYGYAAVLALAWRGPGPDLDGGCTGRGWVTLETGPGGVRLVGKVLQGPVALASFPSDWGRRAQARGPRPCHSDHRRKPAARGRGPATLSRALTARGIPVRHDRLTGAEDVRARALSPGAAYTVAMRRTPHRRCGAWPEDHVARSPVSEPFIGTDRVHRHAHRLELGAPPRSGRSMTKAQPTTSRPAARSA